ncbi:MAG: DEAD/DEAH box helicase [Planctomycetota bacterium]
MQLRPYQISAVEQTFAAWRNAQAVLGVAATGLGKTIALASILARHPGRTMIIAHREELIFQAAQKVKLVTGIEADIEMADMRAAESSLHGKARVVISTIQTQTAGSNGGRMQRFDPHEFGLLIVDEAHHSTAVSFRRAIDHYRQNPDLHILGVTATPDRADEEALGQVFDDVAFDYDIRFGIEDGWLVPIVQRSVHVDGLDLSAVRTTAGDLNGADLASVMEYERNLHEVAAPTIDLTADGRKTLIFAASLAHAERLCEILNRHRTGCARWVSGKTPKPERRQLFDDYARREFQYLVNVGVATEGFDDPGISVIVMARPTKSRALYSQMIGRGTRPVPGCVDDPDMFGSGAMRREAIASSGKASLEVIDFVGNSGRHRLITTADVLGGNYSDEVIDRARKTVERDGQGNVLEKLDEARRQIREERERAKREEAKRRAHLIAGAKYRMAVVDPFDVFGLEPQRERGWNKDRPLTDRMVALLERQGINTRNLTFTQAKQLIAEITGRWDAGKCSYKQARVLASRGLPTSVSQEKASEWIDAIAQKEGWKSRKQHRRTEQSVAATVTAERY